MYNEVNLLLYETSKLSKLFEFKFNDKSSSFCEKSSFFEILEPHNTKFSKFLLFAKTNPEFSLSEKSFPKARNSSNKIKSSIPTIDVIFLLEIFKLVIVLILEVFT